MSKPRLTQHQREVHDRLTRLSRWRRNGWVRGDDIGSPGALARLVDKGYAERTTTQGPRGGAIAWFRPADWGPT